MFTFQVTRLHERHLSDYRLQGVSPLPHIVRRGAREREGESTTWQMARWDDTSVRSFLSSCLSRDLPGSFSALLRCITRFARHSPALRSYRSSRCLLILFIPVVAVSHSNVRLDFLWASSVLMLSNIIGCYLRGKKDIREKEERTNAKDINKLLFWMCASINIYFIIIIIYLFLNYKLNFIA